MVTHCLLLAPRRPRYKPQLSAAKRILQQYYPHVELYVPTAFKNGYVVGFCVLCNIDITIDSTILKTHFVSCHPGMTHTVVKRHVIPKRPRVSITDFSNNAVHARITVTQLMLRHSIPLNLIRILQNDEFQQALHLIGGTSASTLRLTIPKILERQLQLLRDELDPSGQYHLLIDGTSPLFNRKLVNILIQSPSGTMLIASVFMNSETGSALCSAVKTALTRIHLNLDNILYVVTDGARNNSTAYNLMRAHNPKLRYHVCISHGLHRIAAALIENLPLIHSALINLNRFFTAGNVNNRKRRFKSLCRLMGYSDHLFQQPSATRWGEYVKSGIDVQARIEVFREFVNSENSTLTSRAIATALNSPGIIDELRFLSFIGTDLVELTTSSEATFPSIYSMDAIAGYVERFFVRKILPHDLSQFHHILVLGEKRVTKYYRGLIEIRSLQRYFSPSWVFDNEALVNESIPSSLESPQETGEWLRFCSDISELHASPQIEPIQWWTLNSHRYQSVWKTAVLILSIPITSASVERSFSALRTILNSRRNRLSEERIEIELMLKINKLN